MSEKNIKNIYIIVNEMIDPFTFHLGEVMCLVIGRLTPFPNHIQLF